MMVKDDSFKSFTLIIICRPKAGSLRRVSNN